MQADLAGFVNGAQAGGGTGFHQVAGDLGLAVHHHLFAAGELVHVDAVALALEQQLDAVVGQALGMGTLGHAGLLKQVHGDLLQHTGTDAAEHVVAALALNDDVVNAGLVQQLTEQQAGGAGADDGDLSTHEGLLGDLGGG